MTTYSIIPAIALIAYIPLLFLVLSHRPWQRQHKLLVLYLIAAIIWGLSSFLLHSSLLPELKTELVKVLLLSIMWMATHYYYFARTFGYKPDGFGVKFGYGFILLFIVLASLNYMPQQVSFTPGEPIIIDWGPMLWLIAFPMLTLAGMLLFSLVKKLSISTDPAERNRVAYLLISVGITTVFLSTNIVPLFRGYPVDHLGNIINASILTYATLRHQLVSIKSFARRGLVFGAATFVVGGLYLLTCSALHYGFGFELDLATIAIAIVGASALIAIFWNPLERALSQMVDQLFYGKRLFYRNGIIDFTRRTQSLLDLKGIVEELTQLVAGATDSKSVNFLIQKGEGEDFISLREDDNPALSMKLKQDSPIVDWLVHTHTYLTREALDTVPEFRSLWKEERDTIDSARIKFFLPLIARNKLVAILTLAETKMGATYDVDDMNLLQTLANQAAVIIDNARLYAKSQELAENLQLTNQLTRIVTSSLDIKEVYERFVQELRKVMDADWASVALLKEGKLHFFALSSVADSVWKWGETIPLDGTGTAYVTETKQTLVERDLLKRHKFWTGDVHLQSGMRSIVYTPLIIRGEAIGALVIASRHPNAYDSRQVAMLEQLSGQLAATVENFRLYGRAQTEAIEDSLTGLFNRRYFEKRLSEEIDRYSRYGGSFSVVISDLDFFKVYNDSYGHRAGDRLLNELGQIVKGSVRKVDLCFRYGGDEFALLLLQAPVEEAYEVAERVRKRFEAEMRTRQIALALSLGVAFWPVDGLTADDIIRAADAALYYAKQTGGNRTCLFSNIVPPPAGRTLEQVSRERVALDIVYALSATVDAKDHYTYSHSRKVATYAVALAEAAGLNQDRVALANTAALLHDIGKIGVPDKILNKIGKLTAEEWEAFKSHSALGATIISYVPTLTPCLPIILHHHERYNGLGYPNRLKAEDIPLEARILAVADAFTAMTTARPYRGALSYKEAIEELKRGAGTQFDPNLVELFVPIALSSASEETPVRNPNDSPAQPE